MNDHTRGGVMCSKTNTFPPKVMSNGWILVCELIPFILIDYIVSYLIFLRVLT